MKLTVIRHNNQYFDMDGPIGRKTAFSLLIAQHKKEKDEK